MTRRAPSFARDPLPGAGALPRWTRGTRSACSDPRTSPSPARTAVNWNFSRLKQLDVRYGSRDGAACAEFSWEGLDEGTPASGRGWVAFGTAGRLVGHFFIHKGDDSGFVAERE
jgi:hypothetical protein